MNWWLVIYHIIPMILDQMELLLSINFCDFSSDVHSSEDGIDLFKLFWDLSEDGGTIKGAADTIIPAPALLSQNLLVSVGN